MPGYSKTWLMTGITIGLGMGAVLLTVVVFAYAEATRDPDAIEAPAFFIGLVMLLLAAIMVPVTVRVWLYEKERNERITLSLNDR